MANIDANTSLSELEPYILGKAFTEDKVKVTRIDRNIFKQFMEMLSYDPIAKQFFDVYENYRDFYKTATDFRNQIPKEVQAECFYAAKLGKYYSGVPSFCAYMVKKAYDECYGIPNLIVKKLPLPMLRNCFSEDYFGAGICLRDVICSICCESYAPLSDTRPKNRVGDFTELYIRSANMVAAVPNKIADALDDASVLKITETANGLAVDGLLLRTMCNYAGAVSSTYDLRELI